MFKEDFHKAQGIVHSMEKLEKEIEHLEKCSCIQDLAQRHQPILSKATFEAIQKLLVDEKQNLLKKLSLKLGKI